MHDPCSPFAVGDHAAQSLSPCKQGAQSTQVVHKGSFDFAAVSLSSCNRIMLLPVVASISKLFPLSFPSELFLTYACHACHLHAPAPSDHDMLDAGEAVLYFLLALARAGYCSRGAGEWRQ